MWTTKAMNSLRYFSIIISFEGAKHVESYRTLKSSPQHQLFSECACSLTSDGNCACVCVKCLCVLASFEKKGFANADVVPRRCMLHNGGNKHNMWWACNQKWARHAARSFPKLVRTHALETHTCTFMWLCLHLLLVFGSLLVTFCSCYCGLDIFKERTPSIWCCNFSLSLSLSLEGFIVVFGVCVAFWRQSLKNLSSTCPQQSQSWNPNWSHTPHMHTHHAHARTHAHTHTHTHTLAWLQLCLVCIRLYMQIECVSQDLTGGRWERWWRRQKRKEGRIEGREEKP